MLTRQSRARAQAQQAETLAFELTRTHTRAAPHDSMHAHESMQPSLDATAQKNMETHANAHATWRHMEVLATPRPELSRKAHAQPWMPDYST